MGLVETITANLDVAWARLGNLVQPVTYRRTDPGAYDPTTQKQGQVVTATTVRAILMGYEAELVAKLDVRAGDLRCIIRAKDFPFQPKPGDTVQHGAATWTVVQATGDGQPARIYWDITLRR